MKGKISGFSVQYDTGSQILAFELSDDFKPLYDGLKDKELDISIKEYKNHRSLNANNLMWKAVTLIADVVRASKDEIYIIMLERYGVSKMFSVQSHIDVKPYFKYYKLAGAGKVNGKEFTHYKVFKGSSEFDTREMSIMIDGVLSELKEMGIPFVPESDISIAKEEWGR